MMEDSNFATGYAVGRDSNGGYGNNGIFGNDWAWIVILLLFGYGGRGFGGFGGFGGGFGGGSCGCGSPCATQADLAAGFNNSAVLSGINGIDSALCQGFNGINTAILQSGYNTQGAINGLSHQLSDCCCATQRAIDGVRYDMATQACDTRHAIQDSTRQILDFLTTDKIATLQAENQSLKFKASQAEQNAFITANQQAQTAELIRRLGADCPTPAYVVQPPQPVTFPVNSCGQFNGYGYNNGGCGCGCA